MEMHRKQHGHNGIAMSSLKTYIHGHKAFVGLAKSVGFDDGFSSAYVFTYNDLGVNIEAMAPQNNTPITPITPMQPIQEDLPF